LSALSPEEAAIFSARAKDEAHTKNIKTKDKIKMLFARVSFTESLLNINIIKKIISRRRSDKTQAAAGKSLYCIAI
jgi:hypothetical protein